MAAWAFFIILGSVFLVLFLIRAGNFRLSPAAPPWVTAPTNVNVFPLPFQRKVYESYAQWEEKKQTFLNPLMACSLTLPLEQTPFWARAKHEIQQTGQDINHIFVDVDITYPTYTVPPYIALPILVDVYYLISKPSASLDQITQEIKAYGLPHVLASYPGAWLSGDPYGWFIKPNQVWPAVSPVKPPLDLINCLSNRLEMYRSINPGQAQIFTTPPLFTTLPLAPHAVPFLQKDQSKETVIGLTESQVDTYNIDHIKYKSMLYSQFKDIQRISNKLTTMDFVSLPDSVRDKHAYVVGKSGTGKSTLILNMVRQDIERGEGVCVIDPHGDLAEELLTYIPEARIKDTIYINAADTKFPVSINVLSTENDEEIVLLADDLLVTFRRLSDSWGERMENILRYCFHTLLRYPGATFLDIQNLLQDPAYRSEVLATIKDKNISAFWKHTYPSLAKDAAQPILNRMSKFSLSPPLAGILSHAESRLNFFQAIQNKQIIIVNLAKGKIGEDNSKLLGSLIVSQLQLAAMRRANLPKAARTPFYVYVDEFQNFTSSAFETILSEARKYKLCLTLAHQFISQIDASLKHAIFGNVGTMFVFPLAQNDAAPLNHELGGFDDQSVATLDPKKHEALYRPASGASGTIIIQTLPPKPVTQDHTEAIIKHSRLHYSVNGPQPPPRADEPPLEEEQYSQQPDEHASPKDNAQGQREFKFPADAPPLELSREEKLLHYLKQTSYLSNRQIIKLCCSDLGSENSQKKEASKLTTKLEAAGQLSSFLFEREKICYNGRKPSLRRHELGVRDVFVSIAQSGYRFNGVKFYNTLTQEEILNPDLSVSFIAEDETEIPTFWEFDNGTEGDEVLISKINRYKKYFQTHKIIFVFTDEARITKLARKLPAPLPPIYHTTISRLGEEVPPQRGVRSTTFGLFNQPDLSVQLFTSE